MKREISRITISNMIMCGIFAVVLIFSGCSAGKEEADTEGQKAGQETAGLPQEFNWREEKFANMLDISAGSPLYIADVAENLVRKPDFSYDYEYGGLYDFWGDKVYIFERFYLNEGEGHKYFLNIYDLNTKKSQCEELLFHIPEVEDFTPVGFAVAGEDEFVFFSQKYDEEGEGTLLNYYAVTLNKNGEVIRVTDIYPAIKQMDIRLLPYMTLERIACDGQGLMYICNPDAPWVGVVDETGALADIMELSTAASAGVSCIMKSPEGIPLFEVSDIENGKNTVFWYDTVKKDMVILAENAYEYVVSRGMNGHGQIYYRLMDDLICWNVRTGARERLFDLKGNGVVGNDMLQRWICSSTGELFLLDLGDKCLYRFSHEEPDKSGNEIRIADLCFGDDYIKSGAASFSRKKPAYKVEYEKADFDDRQAYRDRVMAELVAGNGPELLVVNGEDMKALYEKGVLADILPIISDSVKDSLLPGVLRAGMREDKLLGIGYRIQTQTMYTSKDIWEKDTWSLEEFIGLIEEKEKSGMQNMFAGVNNLSAYNLFYDMVMTDLKNSPFIDWDKGKCSFDCELFYKTIEIAEKYGVKYDDSIVNREEEIKKQMDIIKAGEAVVYIADSVNSYDGFSRNMDMLGEKYFCIGYPAAEESESYFNSYSFLVVNKAAEENQAVKEYIDYFFDKERQDEWGLGSVRRDVLEDKIQKIQDSGWEELPVKADGSSYLEDYIRYLDNCAPKLERQYEGVIKIIDEEIKEYLAGAKGTKQTADAIQNRVQLYLDENK